MCSSLQIFRFFCLNSIFFQTPSGTGLPRPPTKRELWVMQKLAEPVPFRTVVQVDRNPAQMTRNQLEQYPVPVTRNQLDQYPAQMTRNQLDQYPTPVTRYQFHPNPAQLSQNQGGVAFKGWMLTIFCICILHALRRN
jgi:hypothetical protein